jgi:16S rRNA processing protein RimM
MRKEDCFYLGRIAKKHSFKGDVVIALDTDEPELYKNMESVFVALGPNLIPFFIEKSLLQKGNKLRVKFEEIDTQQDAESILNAEVYLPLSLLPKLTGNKFYFHEIIGFKVIDKNKGFIGLIEAVNDSAAQTFLEIKHNKDIIILVPLLDDFIKKVDRDKKEMHIEAPEGLIDLYLD